MRQSTRAGPGDRALTAPRASATRTAPRTTRRQGDETDGTDQIAGMPLLVSIFLVSLVVPMTFQVGGLMMSPYRLVLLVAFAPVAIRFFFKTGLRAFDWAMLAWVAWSVIALLAVHGGAEVVFAGSRVVEVLGAWMLARAGVRSAADLQRVVRVLFWMVVVLTPFAIVESYTGRALLTEVVPNGIRVLSTEPRWGLERAGVVFVHPILFGVFVSAAAGLCWFLYDVNASILARGLRLSVVFVATFFSLSAGAFIGLVWQAGMIMWDILFRGTPKHWLNFTRLTIAGYVALDLASNRTPFNLVVDYLTFNSGSAYNRILIWRFGIENVWRNPVFGIGLNDWSRPGWMGGSVDNFWLLNAMQFGVLGFLLLALGMGLQIRGVVRAPLTDELARAARVGWMVTMAGIVIAGGTVHYWHGMLSFFVFLVGMGGWIATTEQSQAESSAEDAALRNGRRPAAARTSPPDRAPMPGRVPAPQPARRMPEAPRPALAQRAESAAPTRPDPSRPAPDRPPPSGPRRPRPSGPTRPTRPRRGDGGPA